MVFFYTSSGGDNHTSTDSKSSYNNFNISDNTNIDSDSEKTNTDSESANNISNIFLPWKVQLCEYSNENFNWNKDSNAYSHSALNFNTIDTPFTSLIVY